jgi:hypothetical protein
VLKIRGVGWVYLRVCQGSEAGRHAVDRPAICDGAFNDFPGGRYRFPSTRRELHPSAGRHGDDFIERKD